MSAGPDEVDGPAKGVLEVSALVLTSAHMIRAAAVVIREWRKQDATRSVSSKCCSRTGPSRWTAQTRSEWTLPTGHSWPRSKAVRTSCRTRTTGDGGLTAFKALLVGNAHFPRDPHGLGALNGPLNDVDALHDELSNADTGIFSCQRPVKDARAQKILDVTEEFFSAADRGDCLLFYIQRARTHRPQR